MSCALRFFVVVAVFDAETVALNIAVTLEGV
jgi:hypothetical protein